MTQQPRKRSRKWDVPAESVERVDTTSSLAADATQKARERAAKLAAKLAAEGKLASSAPPPPIIAPQAIIRPSASVGPPSAVSQEANSGFPDPQILKLEHVGYMAELEINDLPARVNLTKKAMQDKIALQSGAAIVTKGRFVPPEGKELLAGQGEKPLYLNIQAPIEAKVQVALHLIKDAIKNFGKPEQPGNQNGSQNQNYVQDRVFVGLDFAPPEYNVKEKLEGPNGSYLQHIIAQTGAKVHLRGKGSGFIEQNSGRESFEALHIYISHPRQDGLQAAKSLCENLLQSVHGDFKVWDQTKRQQSIYQPPAYHQQPYQQPPTIYPGYNVPPPHQSSQNMAVPPPSVYPQRLPHGSYQGPNYPPPPSYQNQPPPSYKPPNMPPYPQPPSQHLLPGYQPPKSSDQPPFSDNRSSTGYAPPPDPYQASYQSNQKSDTGKPQPTSYAESSKTERKRRRFTEDPDLIRKATEPASTKESTSHSLDSNIKFRSTGLPTKETSRDQSDSHSGGNESAFLSPRSITNSRGIDVFKPPPVLPTAAKKASKKKAISKTKNALSSLLAYEDSDSDEES